MQPESHPFHKRPPTETSIHSTGLQHTMQPAGSPGHSEASSLLCPPPTSQCEPLHGLPHLKGRREHLLTEQMKTSCCCILSRPLTTLENFSKCSCDTMSNLGDTYKLGFLLPKGLQLSMALRGSEGNLGLVTKTHPKASIHTRPHLTTDYITGEQRRLGVTCIVVF